MGAYISNYRLANLTARLGALGVVSGVGLRHIVLEAIRRGDEEAIETAKGFPLVGYVKELLHFAPGGFKHSWPTPQDSTDPRYCDLPRQLSAITAYIEVMRAKRGHSGKIGVNIMWKCALTVLPTIYGAMMANADALLCGAGVPMELPDIVHSLRDGRDMEYLPLTGTGTNARLKVSEDDSSHYLSALEPPAMLPILSNFAFPKRLLDVWERSYGGVRPAAFVLENHTAGGHNAPPRNKVEFAENDDIGSYFDKVADLGVPVYVAGAFEHGGTRGDLLDWTARGAYGIQVGSRFALSDESGMRRDLKDAIIEANRAGGVSIKTGNIVSPTGYPFKYVELPGTLADPAVYAARKRICNRGYLCQSHFETLPDGKVKETYICPAMPEKQFRKLGGDPAELADRVCLCNGLLSTAGYHVDAEAPIVTLGISGRTVTERQSARQVVEDILTPEHVAAMEAELVLNAEPARV